MFILFCVAFLFCFAFSFYYSSYFNVEKFTYQTKNPLVILELFAEQQADFLIFCIFFINFLGSQPFD
ncbi:hypothetical protein CYJ66_01460 [Gardnerella vaginalis]|nr:hypothetical protein CYJ66_01460 [Gardnerella vaginalis]PKZ55574.1 hypothetical protein CYJ64_01460 [Gardnerella vaginalis]